MKPDWKDAPEWANWLAVDSNGVWYWYEDEPVEGRASFDNDSGRIARASPNYRDTWSGSLERKPEQPAGGGK